MLTLAFLTENSAVDLSSSRTYDAPIDLKKRLIDDRACRNSYSGRPVQCWRIRYDSAGIAKAIKLLARLRLR